MSANVVMLDRILAHYGPDAEETRHTLRDAVVRVLEKTWPRNGRLSAMAPPSNGSSGAEVLYDKIQQLSPKDDSQRTLQSQELSTANGLSQMRWLLYEQGTTSVCVPLMVILISWLTILFVSFGLFAPSNATVVASLFASALSVSTAMLLILEMCSPYQGLLSEGPVRRRTSAAA